MRVFFPLSCLLLLASPLSFAVDYDRAYIESFVKRHLEDNVPPPTDGKIAIKVAAIDPRVTIKPCQIPLKANIPEKNTGRNVNVKISCDDSTPWKIYLTAKVTTTLPVLVAKKTINKGERINESNVGIAYIAENKIRGEKLNESTGILGAKAKRRIAQGRAINRKSICVVCKGDAVTIIAKSSNFSIKTQGLALSSGNLTEQIKVKNSRTGKVITPQVSAINQVVINL